MPVIPWYKSGKVEAFTVLNLQKSWALSSLLLLSVFLYKISAWIPNVPIDMLITIMYPLGALLTLITLHKFEPGYLKRIYAFPPRLGLLIFVLYGGVALFTANFYPRISRFFMLYMVWIPLIEELYFRGLFYPLLLRKLDKVRALIVISLIFTLAHGKFNLSALTILITSLAATLSYEASGNIWWPVLYHSFFNMLVAIRLYIIR